MVWALRFKVEVPTVEVILLQDVPGVGRRGEIKVVKDGYARNYLLPRKLAEEATPGRVQELRQREQAQEARTRRRKSEAEELARRLHGVVVPVPVRVGESGRLFGAVTSTDVAEALAGLGFNVDRKQLRMEPLKTLGDHSVEAHLFEGVNATFIVRVIPQ
jgi:large subunit ribosomal protein L9